MSRTRVNDDIVAQIAQFCDLGALSTIARANRTAAQIAHIERRRRVISGLLPFSGPTGPTPTDILRLLSIYDALITGSFALNVVVPETGVNDLNIVVGHGRAAAVCAQVESWGYLRNKCRERLALIDTISVFAKKVSTVVSLVRPSDGRRVEIVESATDFAVDAILSFPNTLAQNFVSSSAVCCLYPQYTLNRRAVAASPAVPVRALAAILLKYKSRQFNIHSDNRFLSSPCGTHCPLEYRTLRSDNVAYMRFSDYELTEIDRELPPRTDRGCRAVIHPARDFRVGSHCANMFCPRRNVH